METYDAVKDFINYTTAEDNDLPYGGLVADAPQSAKEAYAQYLIEQNELEAKGIMG